MSFPLRGRFPLSPHLDASPTTKRLVDYAVVDAFTCIPYKGNPAGVCILSEWPETCWLQQVASELNVNATAFLVARKASFNDETSELNVNAAALQAARKASFNDETSASLEEDHAFDIRWFSPITEVELCGHATLASSYLLFGSGIVKANMINFYPKKGGVLHARRVERSAEDGFLVELNFPILFPYICKFELTSLSNTLAQHLVLSICRTSANDILVELPSSEDVEDLTPFFDEIRRIDCRLLIVTGKAMDTSSCDFVSRVFAPRLGVNEDPVCGTAHCALAAFWAKKLNKNHFVAYQASERGGSLHLKVDFATSRVILKGEATFRMSGVLFF